MSVSTEILVRPAMIRINDKNTVGNSVDEIPSTKMLENRSSISSVDSSISLSYDAVPFIPRISSSMACNGTDDESKIGQTICDHQSHSIINNKLEYASDEGFYSVAVNGTSDSSSGNESTSVVDALEEKCSQVENDEDEKSFDPPDEELIKRIVNQVEYYFSDENIVKDAFLLKHVRRNKEGYVSLKLIASFKRVKHIARDWRVVRAALENSSKLEINEAGKKLRRRDPLPLYDQTTPSRTIVAVHLTPEQVTIENVAEIFRECGEIALIRVLRPGNPVPADVRPFYNKHPEMHTSVSALIEFVRTESAHNALNREPLDDDPVRVFELNTPPAKKKNPAKKTYRRSGVCDDYSSSCLSSSEAEDRFQLRALPIYASKTPHTTAAAVAVAPFEQQQWPATAHQQRWSRESGSDSSPSDVSRSRSNSGVYFAPERRRSSAGWDSSSCSDSYGSCRSRSNSGVSIPDIFQMRRYSLPRRESACCCCGYPKIETTAGRRYSMHKEEAGFNPRTLSRCASNESSDYSARCRNDSSPENYSLHRCSVTNFGGSGGMFEKRPSLARPCNANGNWSRSNSACSGSSSDGRRLSDSDGQRFGGSIMRQRSFSNVGVTPDTVLRLPRGPDGGRGFQRELIEYALPE